jgi:hypothetical protein
MQLCPGPIEWIKDVRKIFNTYLPIILTSYNIFTVMQCPRAVQPFPLGPLISSAFPLASQSLHCMQQKLGAEML